MQHAVSLVLESCALPLKVASPPLQTRFRIACDDRLEIHTAAVEPRGRAIVIVEADPRFGGVAHFRCNEDGELRVRAVNVGIAVTVNGASHDEATALAAGDIVVVGRRDGTGGSVQLRVADLPIDLLSTAWCSERIVALRRDVTVRGSRTDGTWTGVLRAAADRLVEVQIDDAFNAPHADDAAAFPGLLCWDLSPGHTVTAHERIAGVNFSALRWCGPNRAVERSIALMVHEECARTAAAGWWPDPDDVMLTWDGDIVPSNHRWVRGTSRTMPSDALARLRISLVSSLRGEDPARPTRDPREFDLDTMASFFVPQNAFEEALALVLLQPSWPTPTAELAALAQGLADLRQTFGLEFPQAARGHFFQGLFPQEWAREVLLREEAAMLAERDFVGLPWL